jgi:hypothetical protein
MIGCSNGGGSSADLSCALSSLRPLSSALISAFPSGSVDVGALTGVVQDELQIDEAVPALRFASDADQHLAGRDVVGEHLAPRNREGFAPSTTAFPASHPLDGAAASSRVFRSHQWRAACLRRKQGAHCSATPRPRITRAIRACRGREASVPGGGRFAARSPRRPCVRATKSASHARVERSVRTRQEGVPPCGRCVLSSGLG